MLESKQKTTERLDVKSTGANLEEASEELLRVEEGQRQPESVLAGICIFVLLDVLALLVLLAGRRTRFLT